jgi:hypothetical protein
MASRVNKAVTELTDEEFERRTLDLIQREFGPGGLVRFIRAYRAGHGDYTEERRYATNHQTLDQIWQDLEQQGLTRESQPR